MAMQINCSKVQSDMVNMVTRSGCHADSHNIATIAHALARSKTDKSKLKQISGLALLCTNVQKLGAKHVQDDTH